MAAKVYDILKGSFLTNEDAFKNWRFILFAAGLAIVMIYTGHTYEKKVHRLAALNERVTELHSEYTDLERRLMFLQMESTIARNIEKKGIAPAKNPPQKIIISPSRDAND
ncbi:FtsL-like putative cell division protein [Nonlabens xiamenensis]|uniref:FtsL-like putative cell division protein n=1 Tax=Nonlabens xiamenensis TaxID=2341043 RepID=UPI001F0CB5CF|nr:FtsL-like putative cell division protein [Nonlabens xiamenensis]